MVRLPVWNLHRQKEIFKKKICHRVQYSVFWLDINYWANRFILSGNSNWRAKTDAQDRRPEALFELKFVNTTL